MKEGPRDSEKMLGNERTNGVHPIFYKSTLKMHVAARCRLRMRNHAKAARGKLLVKTKDISALLYFARANSEAFQEGEPSCEPSADAGPDEASPLSMLWPVDFRKGRTRWQDLDDSS